MSIFVSIAAYRDPELIPTLLDCVRRARYKADLRFGVCWQHAGDEPAPPDLGVKLRLIDVPWRQSRGACWARAEIMKLYDNEDYYLQLDSHHRFVQDWDARLIDQAERSGAARPLLTTYPASYDPNTPLPPDDEPTCMPFRSWTRDGIPLFGWQTMQDWRDRSLPMRARFLAAGMMFTLGRFVSDVPYDPDLYFYGEEATLAMRAFTHGYALLHPSVHAIWHQNSPHMRARHWNDHVTGQDVAVTGAQRDAASIEKARRFLVAPEIGPMGCGSARGAAEYETYAGLIFHRRHASAEARRGEEPPPAPAPVFESTGKRTWTLRIVLDRAALEPAALENPRYWYVAFHDVNDIEVARLDANRSELHTLALGGGQIVIERAFESLRPPASWTVWPTDRRGQWLQRMNGPIDDANVQSVAA